MMDLSEVVLSSLLKFDGYPDAMALPRHKQQQYQGRAQAVADDVDVALSLYRERNEVSEKLIQANIYLEFVTRWAWRDSEGLTDEERLSAIKYYPPIKALAHKEGKE